MVKNHCLFLTLALFVSCASGQKILGSWEEVEHKHETIEFHEDGRLEMTYDHERVGPDIEYEYVILERKKDYFMLNITTYISTLGARSLLTENVKHKVTFKGADTIILHNVDWFGAKSKTYSRKR